MDGIVFNFNLPRIWDAIKRKMFVLIIVTLLGALGVGYYGYKNISTTYMAKISFYVISNPNVLHDASASVSYNEFSMAQNLVPSYMLVLKSDTVLGNIIEKLGMEYTIDQVRSMISSESIEGTSVFYVYVFNGDPYLATEIANSIAEAAPEEIARVVKTGGVEVIDYATLPTVPYSQTNFLKFVIIGGAAGFGVTLVLIVISALLDTTIRKKSEIEKTFSIPVVGEIPIIQSASKKEATKKLLDNNSPFALKEAYSGLRTNIMFITKDEKCPVFAVTSSSQGDGKTMNAVNLAVGFAGLGKKVLLVDCDLRNPSVAKLLGIKSVKEGLSQYLAGFTREISPSQTQIQNLEILMPGVIPPNPAELLATKKFVELIDLYKETYDYIFIDTPPIGVVSDALSFSSMLNGYIIVVRAEESKLNEEKRIVKLLEQVDATISGIIYNAVNVKQKKYNKYYDYRYEK